MATSSAFLPKTTTKTLSGTTASSSATFSETDKDGDCLRLVVATVVTATVIFVRCGRGAQTATAADIAIPAVAGAYVIGVGTGVDTVAVITDAGTASVYACKGEGV